MEEAAQPSKDVNKIQTFVFVDLESTGLKKDNPRIVELSMIAVSRAHLLEMKDLASSRSSSPDGDKPLFSSQGSSSPVPETSDPSSRKNPIPKLPRVVHKYTRLYYPWKLMTPQVERVNGLNNNDLEHLPSFTEASAQALVLFLDLPKPISLVAHNGNRFDFPLLKAELTKVGCVDKFLDLQCTDSLSAVKDIDALIEREDITEITRLAESFGMADLDDELLDEAFNPSKRRRSLEGEEGRGDGVTHHSTPHTGRPHPPAMEVSAAPLLTPIKSRLPGQTSIPATPSKPALPPPQQHTPENGRYATSGTSKAAKETSKVRRTLTYDKATKRKVGLGMSYAQTNLYKRLFDAEYMAHRAEADCEALLVICGHYGSRFVEWADTFATAFARVEPMWVKRQSFSTGHKT